MSKRCLKGSSWEHPRGLAPLLATADEFAQARQGAVMIEWVPRSLREFGMASVESLAREFDLIVVDHPHVGVMAKSGCVVPFDEVLAPAQLELLGRASPGGSHDSYQYNGHQWAIAIDAACQTSAWRPDLLVAQPRTWKDVIALACSGTVLWPLCDVDAAASFFTLAASAGAPCATSLDHLADREVACWALSTMRSVAAVSDSRCLSDNPIDVLDALSGCDDYVYSPLTFCYVSYSRRDCAGKHVAFGDIPVATVGSKPRGSVLGGAGLAVSAYSEARRDAVDYSVYVASPETQRSTYFTSGGQPAHQAAWMDSLVDDKSGGFFSGVGRTIAGAWTRPHGPGFASFQNEMIELFGEWFPASLHPEKFLDELDLRYRRSCRRDAMGVVGD